MCGAASLFLVSVAIAAVFPKEIARSKRQTFEIEDRWIWGSTTTFSVTKKNESFASLDTNSEEKNTATTTKPAVISTVALNRIKGTSTPITEDILSNISQNTLIAATEATISNKTAATNATNTVTNEAEFPNYCDPLPKEVRPDFQAPGRRINEEKCMEYIWEYETKLFVDYHDTVCYSDSNNTVNTAVGGRDTAVGEFPHMGALGWKAVIGTWVFKCGSTLISNKYVLTAAHCAKASTKDTTLADPVPKIVRLGDKLILDKTNKSTSPTDAIISRIIIHPQYNPPMQYYDIALMKLQDSVEFTKLIQPACLWNSFKTGDLGHEATLTGWGVVKSGSLDISPELQAATVNVLETGHCRELLKSSHNRNWKGFQDHQLCAGKLAGGVDSCQGDSGGPLQLKMPLPHDYKDSAMYFVIGVISFGVGCAHPNLPGVYTRVSSFVDWIEDNVWGNS